MWPVLWSLLPCATLQAGVPVPSPPGDLSAVAQASGRPRECPTGSEPSGGRPPNVWDSARDVRLQRYCELLARGMSQLALRPEAARARAQQADEELPGRAAPWVLRARASVVMRRHVQAVEEFSRALAYDARSLDAPATLRAWADALASAGRYQQALDAYRALVPQLAAFAADERVRTLLDGAELAAQVGPAASTEAIAWLREARRGAPRELVRRVAAALALALDRLGAGEEASAVAAPLARHSAKVGSADPSTLTPEQIASTAFVAERSDPAAARAGWQRYLSIVPREAPFRAHAQERLAKLPRGGR